MRIYNAYALVRERRAAVTLASGAFRGWTVTVTPDPTQDPVYTFEGEAVSVKEPLDTATPLELEAARSVSRMLQSEAWEVVPSEEKTAE